MNITICFDSMEEFKRYIKLAPCEREPEPTAEKAAEPEPMAQKSAEPEPAVEKAAEPAYALTDMQKAVREMVKKKGRDAALAVLGQFEHKDDPGKKANSASTMKPENYGEAIAKLEETLNG